MKTTVTLIIVLAIVLILSFFENNYLVSQFNYFDENLDIILENTENGIDSTDKLRELTEWWKERKKVLHAFVPHNDIKDIDGIMVETEKLIENEMYITAATRLVKLDDMIVSIKDSYSFSFGNIF